MNRLKLALLFFGFAVAMPIFLAQWVTAPPSLESFKNQEVTARVSLVPNRKNGLEISTGSEPEYFSCMDAPFVCQFARENPGSEIQIIRATFGWPSNTWLISARSGNKLLLPVEAGELRLTQHKFSVGWASFLFSIVVVGLGIKLFSRQDEA